MTRARLYVSAVMMALTFITTPTLAENYISLKGGITSPLDMDYARPITNNGVDTQYKEGTAMSAALGTTVGDNARFEIEALYQQAEVDMHTITGFGSAGSEGDSTAAALMLNGYYDVDIFTGTRFKPFFGAGIGGAQIKYEGHRTNAVGLIDDSDITFAYQGMAGLNYVLNEEWNFTVEYRYFSTAGLKLMNGENVDYASHSVMGGLRFRF